MLLKHFYILNIVAILLYNLEYSYGVDSNTKVDILRNFIKLRNNVLEVTPYINITFSALPPNCIQIVCKFICFNGKSNEIDKDIDIVSQKSNLTCNKVEELRLYNYEFTSNTLSHGFLGEYHNRVEILYLASSNISDIAPATFANGIFQEIYFEDLILEELRKDFFEDISSNFQVLSVVQKMYPLKSVNSDFLDLVKYQIKYLTMQAGLTCVRNLTGGYNLLNNLIHVDFSYNNFGAQLVETTFSKLSMVEHIDLSHSNLDYIPPYIFSDFTTTLDYLDLSYNNLKTLSHTIFGWRDIPHDLKIYANDNEWDCSCELMQEMKIIFIYQTTTLVCRTPLEFEDWSAFDERLCDGDEINVVTEDNTAMSTFTPSAIITDGPVRPPDTWPIIKPTLKTRTTTLALTETSTTSMPNPIYNGVINIECFAQLQDEQHIARIDTPLLDFYVHTSSGLTVDITIESSNTIDEPLGVIWFSKVTTEYYKMEINYNEYGLGCYHEISYVTTVEDLLPNVAYTFCLAQKNQPTVSPFSCKSVYVTSNLSIQYSAWLTHDMKATGLSLVIFGVVLFLFAGVVFIYLLLKKKPILLKGSKRVTTAGKDGKDILVLPRARSIKELKKKEELLESCKRPFSRKRRDSLDSVASYDSYINSNLYEAIPAYLPIEMSSTTLSSSTTTSSVNLTPPAVRAPATPKSNVLPPISLDLNEDPNDDSNYFTPLPTISRTSNVVSYAEIPYRGIKRISNDPLPEVPIDKPPINLNTNCSADDYNNVDYQEVGAIYMLDSVV